MHPVLKRQLFFFKRSFPVHIISFFLFPVVLYALLVMPVNKFYIDSWEGMQYAYWVQPGFWLLVSSMVAFVSGHAVTWRTFAAPNLLNHYRKTSVSNFQILLYSMLWSFVLALLQLLTAMIISAILVENLFSFHLFLVIPHILPLLLLFSVAGLLIGTLVSGLQATSMIDIFVFVLFAFGIGIFLPANTQSSYLAILEFTPAAQVLDSIRAINSHEKTNFFPALYSLLLAVIVFVLNLIIVSKNSKFRK